MKFVALLSILSASIVLASVADNTAAVCEYLHSNFPDRTAWDPLNPHAIESIFNAATYVNTITHYWNGANGLNRPLCIFFPSSAEEVSAGVKQLNKYPNVQFALKSGGHNFNKGISSTNGGVLFSFNENLSSVSRSEDGNSFLVGPGARWGDVYNVSTKTNQIVVGGRLANIGVAGFVLGGGLSYYSAQYGLACDNVINFEVVLPNGTIANANKTSNPDLWWALKGGGNRFGIVTKLTLQAHPAGVNGQVWGGIRLYSADDRQAIFQAISNFIREYPDPKAAVIPTFDFGLPNAVISSPALFFFYDGPSPPANAFAGIENIKALTDTTGTTTYSQLTSEAGGGKIYGINAAARVNTFPNMSPDRTSQLFEDHWDLTFTTQPLSVRVARASAQQGGNALGLDPASGDRIWVENDLIWFNPTCDDTCPGYLREMTDDVNTAFYSRFKGEKPTNYESGDVEFISVNPLFMNDAADYQDVYASYGATNHARLQQIAKEYNPTGFMNRQGGWPLG